MHLQENLLGISSSSVKLQVDGIYLRVCSCNFVKTNFTIEVFPRGFWKISSFQNFGQFFFQIYLSFLSKICMLQQCLHQNADLDARILIVRFLDGRLFTKDWPFGGLIISTSPSSLALAINMVKVLLLPKKISVEKNIYLCQIHLSILCCAQLSLQIFKFSGRP